MRVVVKIKELEFRVRLKKRFMTMGECARRCGISQSGLTRIVKYQAPVSERVSKKIASLLSWQGQAWSDLFTVDVWTSATEKI